MFTFKPGYFLLFLLLFCVEVFIALYVHDAVIRPHIGDLLVVIMIYCLVRSVSATPVITAAIAVLLFAYAIETLQHFNIVTVLGLQGSKLARVVIGTYFTWMDMLAYTLGIALVLAFEWMIQRRQKQKGL